MSPERIIFIFIINLVAAGLLLSLLAVVSKFIKNFVTLLILIMAAIGFFIYCNAVYLLPHP